jgi:hypothetical protein
MGCLGVEASNPRRRTCGVVVCVFLSEKANRGVDIRERRKKLTQT